MSEQREEHRLRTCGKKMTGVFSLEIEMKGVTATRAQVIRILALITFIYAFRSPEESRINNFSSVTTGMCSIKAEKVRRGSRGKPAHLFIEVPADSLLLHASGWSPDLHNWRIRSLSFPRFMNSGFFMSSNYVLPYIPQGPVQKHCACVCAVFEFYKCMCLCVRLHKWCMFVCCTRAFVTEDYSPVCVCVCP